MSTGKYQTPLQTKGYVTSQPKSATSDEVREFNSSLNIDDQIIPTLRKENNSSGDKKEDQLSPTPKADSPIT